MWVHSIELDSCHRSGFWNSEVAPTRLKMTSIYSADIADYFHVGKKDGIGRKELNFIIGRIRKIAISNC